MWIALLLLTGCHKPVPSEDSYSLVLLVNARQLDYSNASSCLKTTAKHPSDGSKNGDVGHAWILLKGPEGEIEGGQSGETGRYQPKYMEGVIENIELQSENPVSYLFCSQCDGYFQQGNGGHRPSLAVAIEITSDQYQAIQKLIETYPYHEYSLTSHQCTTFVKEAAAIANIQLEDEVLIPIPQCIKLSGREELFWSDPKYSVLTCGSPDRLEENFKELVRQGCARNVTKWYLRTHGIQRRESCLETLRCFPERIIRWQMVDDSI